ncbi:beta-lactamase superfamily domain protein [Oxobacter pfennigii]|uniref:Beta-lactamase superfamily domain protein n=1 Tax=Oxobacter pfennigii TaxID=36849 RepID=A0A0P8WD38_9CLOT|nr:MBL fold metallo-hydrolase [Oxobacter pfennigii]KPU45686.1 beta-lactamase superfamily domain protein [Oxobacter pfennigii]
MKKKNIKIYYLYNSGFTVETENCFLIFDYFKDSVLKGEKSISNGAIGEDDLRIDKKIFVFSSHSHADHFNKVILKWQNIRPDITYILSSDIKLGYAKENIKYLSPYEEINLGDIIIKAYGSTDIGVSFYILADGVSIFHSGDLNWWYWWDDTPEEIEKAEKAFKEEIEKIKGNKIDIAFFPVDPRLEHNYSKGGEYFIKEITPSYFIPMHFGVTYEITEKFAHLMKDSPVKVLKLSRRGQEMIL